MILSPMQQDYVTRKEFNEFEIRFDKHEHYVKDGFEKVFEQLDTVEANSIKEFKKVHERFDSLETNMNSRFDLLTRAVVRIENTMDRMDKRLGNLETKVDNLERRG